ncbi:WD40-like repeat [Gaiella occulta]|uniref:WD40-like repeat n=1 Tax=Gaiella occulta TaxID=1002870 RepID=A0A7M2YWK6_9ACTN|nr:PQQ-binding-like beta-propeller repeat protein [Gaiella occulta]RDI74274.1 WD40-like repeat [Gaiella occulta]
MNRTLLAAAAALAAIVLLGAGFAAGYVVAKRGESADVRGNATQEFVPTQAPAPKPLPGVAWPTWGFDATRNRVSPYAHKPPYRVAWTFRARTLLEFPPAIAYGNLYVTNNSGVTFAVDVRRGTQVWQRRSGRCAASSPAVDGKVVYQAFLNRPPCNSSRSPERLSGEVVAFDALSGRVRWRTEIGPTESSPLVHQGRVYVGDWRGTIYALDQRTGTVRWTFRTGGRVKGALAALGNRLFAGSYDGRLYALDSRTGALQWRSSSQDRLGGRGRFYSTPAVAYGRVFIGSTDGKVYAFGATTGDLLWSRSTGGYVYSSPAVWERLVYAGSYSGALYAIDAASGETAWRFAAGGPISGAPTVMGGLVYVATLGGRTYAVDARSGRRVWSFPDGQYSPIVADADTAVLVGRARLYGLRARQPLESAR